MALLLSNNTFVIVFNPLLCLLLILLYIDGMLFLLLGRFSVLVCKQLYNAVSSGAAFKQNCEEKARDSRCCKSRFIAVTNGTVEKLTRQIKTRQTISLEFMRTIMATYNNNTFEECTTMSRYCCAPQYERAVTVLYQRTT